MLKESLQTVINGLDEMMRTWMISLHSYISHVPFDKYASTCVISKETDASHETCSQGLPVPPPRLLQKFSKDSFLATGKRDVATMLDILSRAGLGLNDGERILDFGCASARMLRWLYPFSGKSEIWGVDVNANNLLWCRHNLCPPFRFSGSTRIPHLPFEDRYFSFIYAGSVFTHIEELADTWLLELKRILQPEGRLYLTIHDNETIKILKDESHRAHWFDDCMRGKQELADKFDQYAASKFGMFSILRSNAPHFGLETTPNVYYDRDYFLGIAASYFRIVSTTPQAYGYQTAVLMQKEK